MKAILAPAGNGAGGCAAGAGCAGGWAGAVAGGWAGAVAGGAAGFGAGAGGAGGCWANTGAVLNASVEMASDAARAKPFITLRPFVETFIIACPACAVERVDILCARFFGSLSKEVCMLRCVRVTFAAVLFAVLV